jgi:DNA-binding response OmpR family regulator
MTRILIAEDDPLIGSFLQKGFRSRGYSTLLVDDGEQAQHHGRAEEFDLMVLDMGLPKHDGFEVLRELRSNGRAIPIIIITGRREIDAEMCIAAGANDYLQKPFPFEELLERVKRLLTLSGVEHQAS